MIEKRLSGETRLPVSVIIRTPAQLKRIVGTNPFLREPGVDARKLHVTFLAGPASKPGLAALAAVKSGADRWHAAGAEIYLHCPDGYGRTKLDNTAIERLLSTRATTRNWNTVKALHEMSRASACAASPVIPAMDSLGDVSGTRAALRTGTAAGSTR